MCRVQVNVEEGVPDKGNTSDGARTSGRLVTQKRKNLRGFLIVSWEDERVILYNFKVQNNI